MRKILSFLLVGCLLFSFSGCSLLPFSNNTLTYKYQPIEDGIEITGYTASENMNYEQLIEIPETIDNKAVISIGNNAFEESKLRYISLPESLQYIETSAFMSSKDLVKVKNNSKKITKIANYAFYNCSKLFDFELPDTLTYLGDCSFSQTAVANVKLPSSLTHFGFNAFSHSNVESISFPNNLSVVPTRMFSDVNLNMLIVPETINSLYASCFSDNKNLETVVLSHGVETVGEKAFMNCSNLVDVDIPVTVTSIEDDAFKNTSKDLFIRCKSGSYAEKYAKENNFKCKSY